jgi:hypothetical protein
MTSDFPPRAIHGQEIQLLAQTFATVLDTRTAFYVSSPLTTGERAFEWHVRNGNVSASSSFDVSARFRRDVMEPNRRQAAQYVRELRRRTGRVVIDPTALEDVPEWTQGDYLVLWGTVIQQFVEAVVFRPGWQHSSGCAYEFLVASESGARLLNADLAPLSIQEGRGMIAHAVDETRMRGSVSPFLEGVLQALADGTSKALEQ